VIPPPTTRPGKMPGLVGVSWLSARFRSVSAAFRLPPTPPSAPPCARLVAGSVAGRVAVLEPPRVSGCPGGGTGRHGCLIRCWPRGRAG